MRRGERCRVVGRKSCEGAPQRLLLRLRRRHVPERTCRFERVKSSPPYDVYRCTACGFEWAENRTDPGTKEMPDNYCPNCGAKVVWE